MMNMEIQIQTNSPQEAKALADALRHKHHLRCSIIWDDNTHKVTAYVETGDYNGAVFSQHQQLVLETMTKELELIRNADPGSTVQT